MLVIYLLHLPLLTTDCSGASLHIYLLYRIDIDLAVEWLLLRVGCEVIMKLANDDDDDALLTILCHRACVLQVVLSTDIRNITTTYYSSSTVQQ